MRKSLTVVSAAFCLSVVAHAGMAAGSGASTAVKALPGHS
jgi:hypothetical protein